MVVALAAGLGAAPVPSYAQKARPTTTGPDADGDGVPDSADRCPGTPRGTRVNALGCPVELLRPGQQPVGAPASDTARQGAGPGVVAPQSAGRPAAPPAADTAPRARRAAPPPAMTAGLALAGPEGDADATYLRRFARGLDSTIVSVVGVFRNTSGQPMSGAGDPTVLSQRERDRWTRCRDLHWDLTTYSRGLNAIRESPVLNVDADAGLSRAIAELDSALRASEATIECDNVASMITAPDRWTPWGSQYESTARAFYGTWYTQLRGVHDKLRAFIVAFNAAADAAERMRLPAALQRNPPYAGAAPR
jgi:hypothetical protein